jgi:hypothetical protein
VKNRRPINEDDIYLTEILLARSYGNLKQSVADAASDTLGTLGESVGGTIRRHPYATAGAAVGAGILLFGLFRLMNPGSSSGGKNAGGRNHSPRPTIGMEIISILMPMILPYITGYLEKNLGRKISGDRKNA